MAATTEFVDSEKADKVKSSLSIFRGLEKEKG